MENLKLIDVLETSKQPQYISVKDSIDQEYYFVGKTKTSGSFGYVLSNEKNTFDSDKFIDDISDKLRNGDYKLIVPSTIIHHDYDCLKHYSYQYKNK